MVVDASVVVDFLFPFQRKNTNFISRTLMKEINLSSSLYENKKLTFISSSIKSSFFATLVEKGLTQNNIVKLIKIYKNIGIDLSEINIVPKSKLEILFEETSHGQKIEEEKILYVSLEINKKANSLYYYKLQDGQDGYFNRDGASVRMIKTFINPLSNGYYVTSKFGNRNHPILNKTVFHRGVDYGAKLGAPIYATAEGVIEYLGNKGGYGKYIRIKHENGYSTCYAHISQFSKTIKPGSKVKQGQIIAYVGSTGIATGPHLHYEVIYNGKHVDPLLTREHIKKVALFNQDLKKFKILIDIIDKVIKKKKSLKQNKLQRDYIS